MKNLKHWEQNINTNFLFKKNGPEENLDHQPQEKESKEKILGLTGRRIDELKNSLFGKTPEFLSKETQESINETIANTETDKVKEPAKTETAVMYEEGQSKLIQAVLDEEIPFDEYWKRTIEETANRFGKLGSSTETIEALSK